MKTTQSLRRLATGQPALDAILGGGIPELSVNIVAGEPGSGKTVLVLQTIFNLAKEGRRTIYFTTLSEPAIKLLRYMQLFSFFDPEVVGNAIVFNDLGTVIRTEGSDGALRAIGDRVAREAPDIVVIDSFKAIHDLLGDASRSRAMVYDLAVQMASWGATTFLVGEYTANEITTQPEFAIADGIVRLISEHGELVTNRQLEVIKLRGSWFGAGRHYFDIATDGLVVYPRVPPPVVEHEALSLTDDRIATGVSGLDDLLNGGIPSRSSTIIEGGTGTGKTLFGLQFLIEGARRGEAGLLVTFEETPSQLKGIAYRFGWDLAALEAAGLLEISYVAPVELLSDRLLSRISAQIAQRAVRRIVLDSLSSMSMGLASEQRYKELVYVLTKRFRLAGVTSLLSMEVAELLGSAQLTGHGVSSIADNVILLRYVELDGRLERAMSVLKSRGVQHSTELRQFAIGKGGITVGGAFKRLRGVLTGVPDHVQDGAA